MRQIFAITRKELLLWVQKPGSWIIVFIVPFLFIWIIQAVFGSSGTPVVTIYAVNQDERGKQAALVMQALRDSNNLRVDELATREEADRRVGAGERMAAVIIPPGFSQDLSSPDGAKVEIIVDPARSEQANIVTGLVSAALGPMIVDAEVSRGVEAGVARVIDNVQLAGAGADGSGAAGPSDPATLKQFFSAAMKGVISAQVENSLNDPQVQLDAQPYTAGESQSEAPLHRPSLLDSLVPGYSLMFVYFLVAALAMTVVEERHTGTLRRLLAAPIPRSRILLGKLIPFLLIAVVQLVFVLVLSKFIFGIDLGRSVVGLAIIILASSLAMASLGILIGALARSESQAEGLAIVIVLVMAVVSGAMFPSIQIPGLQAITPHYWSLQGFLNIIARGTGVEGAFLPAGVLVTMSAIFFTIGAIRFRFE